MSIKYKDIEEKLESIGRIDLMKSSAVENNDRLLRHVSKFKSKVMVEIGTYRAISTVVLASVCEYVYTFDVLYQPDAEMVLELFDVKNVHYGYKCKKDLSKIKEAKDYEDLSLEYGDKVRRQIKSLYFDSAFIDGCHNIYQEIGKDFDSVMKCKRVLFHDYREDFPEIIKFCDDMGCEPLGEFALWQK